MSKFSLMERNHDDDATKSFIFNDFQLIAKTESSKCVYNCKCHQERVRVSNDQIEC